MLGTLVLDVGYAPQLTLLLMTVISRKWYILGDGCHGPKGKGDGGGGGDVCDVG